MKSLIALLSAASLAATFTSCERHSWEGSTKKLFEEHGSPHADKSHSDKATPHSDPADKGH